jgi:N4-gp56 family major capsid protein
MAVPTTSTYLADVFDPEVVAGLISKKLTDAIRFSPLCTVDETLAGKPGDTITMPSFGYIGDAEDVAEGADIPVTKLTSTEVEAKIKKAGKGVELTDETLLSGYGDPLGEAVRQIRTSIASKVDSDVLTVLSGIAAPMVHAAAARATADDISDALVLFGEDIIDLPKVLLVSPGTYGVIRKTADWIPGTEIGAAMIVNGAVGMVHGCQVVVSNRLTDAAYIVSPGALALFLKRDTLIETDRDIVAKSTIITADRHYVAYLYDSSKAIKITEVIS